MNADLLETVSRGEDRDRAPFFAGRGDEIGRFEDAVERSKDMRQTQFRIFHGAPGSGKTSLLEHLRDNAPENRVFVDVDPEDLTGRRALMVRINAKLHDAPSPVARRIAAVIRYATGIAEAVVPAPGAKAAGGAAGEAAETVGEVFDRRKRAAVRERSELVLTLDEAQCLDGSHAGVLRSLHTRGLEDLHTVFAFAGLAHTPSVIRGLEGMSRLSGNADVHMDLLDEEDCVDSTRRMLDECGIGGDPARREDVARQVASMAHRWPQHLACAHAALARGLIRAGRDVEGVDLDAVGRETTEARHEYYRKRLEGHPVLEKARFTAAVVAAVRARNAAAMDAPEVEPVVRETQIAGLCEMVMDAEPVDSDIRRCADTPDDVARRMIEKGILGRAPGKPYDATIPSMADWLDGQMPGPGQGRGQGRDRQQRGRHPMGRGGRD